MYIEPNSTVIVCHNIPWDKDYTHVVEWEHMESSTVQHNVIKSNVYKKFEYNAMTYQRVNRGTIRVEQKADDLYDCNYLAFQNTNYGDKWFYAFITEINYINDITSEIRYELDVITTYAFDYEVDTCFIERAHQPYSDQPGDNLVPENLEIGEYIDKDWKRTNYSNNLSIIVAATFDKKYEPHYGGFYGGILSGLVLNTFPYTDAGASEAINFAYQAGEKADGIVDIYVAPTFTVQNVSYAARDTFEMGARPTTIDWYTPRNKKLLTYPYTFLYVTNAQGNAAEFRYEFFSNPSNCSAAIYGDCTGNPSLTLIPILYKLGTSPTTSENIDEKITLSGFPHISYINDVYRQWIAQNANSLSLNSVASAVTSGIGATIVSGGNVLAGVGAGAISLLGSITGIMTQTVRQSVMPNQARSAGSPGGLLAFKSLDFFAVNKSITPEFAQIIDGYFDMFGYAQHKLGKPSDYIGKRPEYCYIKTNGAHISGSIPANHAMKICELYDRGMTFWQNPANIGNYELNNSPS